MATNAEKATNKKKNPPAITDPAIAGSTATTTQPAPAITMPNTSGIPGTPYVGESGSGKSGGLMIGQADPSIDWGGDGAADNTLAPRPAPSMPYANTGEVRSEPGKDKFETPPPDPARFGDYNPADSAKTTKFDQFEAITGHRLGKNVEGAITKGLVEAGGKAAVAGEDERKKWELAQTQLAIQKEALKLQKKQYDAGQDSGGSVICTVLHEKGYIDSRTLMLDEAYRIAHIDARIYHGYRLLADPVARKMRSSDRFTRIIAPFGMAVANECAGRMDNSRARNWIGKSILSVGSVICKLYSRWRALWVESVAL